MEKNIGTFNIAYGIRLYETMKKDLYTLLIKESRETFDYLSNGCKWENRYYTNMKFKQEPMGDWIEKITVSFYPKSLENCKTDLELYYEILYNTGRLLYDDIAHWLSNGQEPLPVEKVRLNMTFRHKGEGKVKEVIVEILIKKD